MKNNSYSKVALFLLPFLFFVFTPITVTAASPVYDFGDAPSPYPVKKEDNGARHKKVNSPSIYIGNSDGGGEPDYEEDGWQSANSEGDDVQTCFTAEDDEGPVGYDYRGGIYGKSDSRFSPQATGSIKLNLEGDAYLNTWIDWNQDGDWDDAKEHVHDDQFYNDQGSDLQDFSVEVPDEAKKGYTYVRVRYSSEQGLSPYGIAEDGEVEDFRIYVEGQYDYGSAASPYPTEEGNNPARHVVPDEKFNNNVFFAEHVDGDAQAHIYYNLDYMWGGDEDFSITFGEHSAVRYKAGGYDQFYREAFEHMPIDFIFEVTNNLGAAAYMNGWIDWNADGDWDDNGEQVIVDKSVSAGTTPSDKIIENIQVPESVVTGKHIFARFRISSQQGLSYSGDAVDGEVVDIPIKVQPEFDYGNAPQNYDSAMTKHRIGGYQLGYFIDGETEVGKDTIQKSSNNPEPLPEEQQVEICALGTGPSVGDAYFPDSTQESTQELNAGEDVTAKVNITAPTQEVHYDVWVDWNIDGDWEDSGEHLVNKSFQNKDGKHQFSFQVPGDAVNGETWVRSRLSKTDGLNPTGNDSQGNIPGGEVEDVKVTIKGGQAKKPLTDFSVNTPAGNLAAPVDVSFDNFSLRASSYEWDFGDNKKSNETNPVHKYQARGTYDVTLEAENAAGKDVKTKQGSITIPYGWGKWDENGGSSVKPTLTEFSGKLIQSVRGNDGAVYTRSSSDGIGWSAWDKNGGSSTEVEMIEFNNKLYQSVRGNDGAVYTRTSSDGISWSTWDRNGGSSHKPTFEVFDSKLFQAVRGNNGAVYTRYSEDGVTWNGWKKNGGSGDVIEMETFNGKLYQTIKGNNGKVYTRNSTDGSNWSEWSESGGSSHAPTLKVYNNELVQTVKGNDGAVYTRTSGDGISWSTWDKNGGSSLRVSMEVFDGRLYQAVRDNKGRLWTRTTDGSKTGQNYDWGEWQLNGGTGKEVEMEVFNGKLYQTIVGNNGKVYIRNFLPTN